MSLPYASNDHTYVNQVPAARRITAAEVLAERTALRKELGHVPHGTGAGWSSYFWVSCDCPNCRDEYDPSGNESAAYMNLEPSFFDDQGEIPSFAFSTLYKQSFLAAVRQARPCFIVGDCPQPRTLSEILAPPAAHALRIRYYAPRLLEEFTLPKLGSPSWHRRTYKEGRLVWYNEGENSPIPATELLARLADLVV
jgi:hypothetical protein